MDFEVFRQVIAAGKLLLADDALVWFHSGVGASVTGQLIRPGEPAGRETQDFSCQIFLNIKHQFRDTFPLISSSSFF